MIALILACTITTPCIYIEPNPTLPGITNMAGAPDIAKDMTHESTPPLNKPSTPQSNAPRHPSNTTPLTTPRGAPPARRGTQRNTTPEPPRRSVQPSHERVLRQSSSYERYTVQPGDCLYTIGIRYQTTWQTLWAHNPDIMDPNLIWPGEEIALP